MRTKTLLLTAALSAAGIATSMAQVFSVNAVGYVNKDVGPGFSLVANPLKASDNSIQALFGGLPDGTAIYVYTGTKFNIGSVDSLSSPTVQPTSLGSTQILPGQGVFLRTSAKQTITFVGEVMQGQNLHTDLPKGLTIASSQVPQAGTAEQLGLVGGDGDIIYQFDTATQKYKLSSFDSLGGGWSPALGTLQVGEAIFIKKNAAGAWDRSFNVNQ